MGGITSSPLFETLVVVVVIWLAAATITSGFVELLGSVFAFRGKHLWRSLELLLGSDSATKAVDDVGTKAARLAATPALSVGATGSEAPPGTTPTTMEHLVQSVPGATYDPKVLRRIKSVNPAIVVDAILAAQANGAPDFESTTVGKLMCRLPAEVRDDADKLRRRVEGWVDDGMTQMSAVYRSRLRVWTAVIGLVVVLLLGIDSAWLGARFYANSTARATVIAAAGSATAADDGVSKDDIVACMSDAGTGQQTQAQDCKQKLIDHLDELDVSRYRFGSSSFWADRAKPGSASAWFFMLLGLAVSVGAVAMGAPFWFDVLKRLMGLRKPSAV